MELAKKKQFVELRKISGWSKAEAARRLKCSRPHVTNIEKMSEPTQPSDRLLADFRELIGTGPGVKYDRPPERVAGMDPPELEKATLELRELHAHDPTAFHAAEGVIQQLRSKVGYRPARKGKKPEPLAPRYAKVARGSGAAKDN